MARTTLLNLVKRNISAWPANNCVAITQDGNGTIFYWKQMPKFNDDDDSWVGKNCSSAASLCSKVWCLVDDESDPVELEAALDYNTEIITQGMFEAITQVKGDLREWRDRIIEIRELQNSLKDELTTLVASIKAEGFDVNINTLPRAR